MSAVRDRLIDEILAGNCVAFVGAGFSMPTVPGWATMLLQAAEKIGAAPVTDLLRDETGAPRKGLDSETLEMAAQMLADTGKLHFHQTLLSLVPDLHPAPTDSAKLAEDKATTRRRIERLFSIPFSAILTTNFDGYITPRRPIPRRDILRPGHRWFAGSYLPHQLRHDDDDRARPVVELHGNLASAVAAGPGAKTNLVMGTADYRARLFRDPGYLPFLRALFTTKTVLFLGFSFTDAYINLLRSEVLALLDVHTFPRDKNAAAIAYAVMNDVDEVRREHLAEHGGLEVISYPSSGGDHSGFDGVLDELVSRTSPKERLGELLTSRNLIWFDPNPSSNDYGIDYLRAAMDSHPGVTPAVLQTRTIDQTMTALRAARAANELDRTIVISHWGHGGGDPSLAGATERSNNEALIDTMHAAALHAPVIVFATDFVENRRRAIARGVYDYVYRWPALFEVLERLCALTARGA